MNINEHDKKEIKGCMKLKEQIDKTIGEDLSEQIIKMENVYVDIVRKRDKEIERLNNIINEFKNYLSQTISKYEIEYDYDEGYYDCLVETNHYLNEFINDFKELKENK